MASRRINISMQIQQTMQKRILNNEYKINEYLPSEAALCEEFGVSRTTLRDAVSGLVEKGLVKRQQGKGVLVIDNTDSVFTHSLRNMMLLGNYNVREFFETREMIECQMAYFASKRATQQQVDELLTCIRKMESITDNTNEYVANDMKFHQIIARASANRLLIAVYDAMGPMLEEVVNWVVVNGGKVESTMRCHMKIYECIKDHDSDGAKQATKEHDQISAQMFQDGLINGVNMDEFQFRQIWDKK
ncbi:MAG: FadR/GntR family transcriptional regulator [Eubacteriales bacterium]|nr:FadR/GntR family transcriptional regulator [Eubacteriales bacterium]